LLGRRKNKLTIEGRLIASKVIGFLVSSAKSVCVELKTSYDNVVLHDRTGDSTSTVGDLERRSGVLETA